MLGEDVFRLILFTEFAVVFTALRYFRIKARASKDKLNRRVEGLFSLIALRLLTFAACLGLITYVYDPALMFWSSFDLPRWLRWLGAGGALSASVFLVATLFALGANLTDTVVTRQRHTLVTRGPYRWVRHPFYCAFSLGLACNAVVAANWYLALTGLAAIVLITRRTRIEEQKLLERFGEQYRMYMDRTGRFLPRRRSAGLAGPVVSLPTHEVILASPPRNAGLHPVKQG